MKDVKRKTEKEKSIIIQKNQLCNYGTVRYMTENALEPENTMYNLSTSFKNAVLYVLPTRYNESVYMQFIEDWGTVSILLWYSCHMMTLFS